MNNMPNFTPDTAKTGDVFLVRNRRTQETMYAEVRESLDYKGQTLLYVERRAHQIRIYRGIREWEGSPGIIPIIRAESFERRAFHLCLLYTSDAADE